MKNNKHSKFNRGEVLIVLVVAFLIVSILMSSAIHYSYIGFNIAKSYAKYSEKSYKAEEILNIIKAGVEDECSDILKKQYDRMLDSFTFTPDQERNDLFKEYFTDAMRAAFCDDGINLQEKFKSYVEASDLNANLRTDLNKNGIFILDSATATYDDDLMYLKIKNIRVNFSDNTGVSATVGADIIVETPILFERGSDFSTDSDYLDYVIIGDNGVVYDVSATTNVFGSIYGGEEGIEIGKTAQSKLKVHAKYVNTRGDIFVSNGGELTIRSKTNDTLCAVYAENILMDSIYSHAVAPSKLDIMGNIYVADDTEINIENSEVTLAGAYLGYGVQNEDFSSGNITTDTDNKSSAILLNKTNSILDLTGLSKLVLAGTAYINPSKSNPEIVNSVITDESVTAKFMQIAYLVPSVCVSTKTNPFQYDSTIDFWVDYDQNILNGGIDLSDPIYDIDENPIVITVPGMNGTTLKYLFLRFNSRAGQSKYIDDYFNLNYRYLSEKADSMLKDGYIQGADNIAYISKGNMLSYRYNTYGNLALSLTPGIASDDYLQSEADRAILRANSLNSTLAYNQTNELTNSVFETIINEDDIDNYYRYDYYTLDDYDFVDMSPATKSKIGELKAGNLIPYDCIVYTGTDKFTVPSSMNKGLVIAFGDVDIDHDFMGCIISKGTVSINAGCYLYNEVEETEQYPLLTLLLDYADQETIQNYFRNFHNVGGVLDKSESLDIKNLVRIDNYAIY